MSGSDFVQMFLTPDVISALIGGVFGVLAAALAGAMAVLVGRRYLDAEALRKKLDIAMDDIRFLLAVEAQHVRASKKKESMGIRQARALVHASGITWSGKFTPSQQRKQR